MPRQTTDQPITTRNARLALTGRAEPYWKAIDTGVALGYRRGAAGGFWIARALLGGRYREARLGRSDDAIRPDGVAILDYRQAVEKAKAWTTGQHRLAAGLEADTVASRPYSVADAIADYQADYIARGGKALAALQLSCKAHILPMLGEKPVTALTTRDIKTWQRAIAIAPARLRTKALASAHRTRSLSTDPDAQRARRASANRVMTILKAALNLAFREGRVASDEAWRRVQPFAKVDAARIRYLTDEECRRLLNACPPDFRTLVTAALLTGCRYGELSALRPADIDVAVGLLTVRASKAGLPRSVILTTEASRFFADAMTGRAADSLLLTQGGDPWGKSHQFRPLRLACTAARIAPAISFHILRHTHASRLAMKGVPMGVIAAQLGHASVTMTAKHYAHLSPGYVADTIRAAFGTLGIAAEAGGALPIRAAG